MGIDEEFWGSRRIVGGNNWGLELLMATISSATSISVSARSSRLSVAGISGLSSESELKKWSRE